MEPYVRENFRNGEPFSYLPHPPLATDRVRYVGQPVAAVVARSLGEMESRINRSVGHMEEAINKSEGEKERQINEAEGRAEEIRALARATATGLRQVATAMDAAGGEDAVMLRIAESYLDELRKLSQSDTEIVLPMDLTDISSVIKTLRGALKAET